VRLKLSSPEMAGDDSVDEQPIRPGKMLPVSHGTFMLYAYAGTAMMTLTRRGLMMMPDSYEEMGWSNGVVVFVGMLCGGLPVARNLRSHVRSYSQLHTNLRTFSLNAVDCFCCSVGHKDPASKSRLRCDRQAIEEVIGEWFGSIRLFNSYVQHEVLRQISPQAHTTYCDALLCAMPILYDMVGRGVWLFMRNVNALDDLFWFSVQGVFWYFIVLPLQAEVIFFVFHRLRGGPTEGIGDVLAALGTVFVAIAACLFNTGLIVLALTEVGNSSFALLYPGLGLIVSGIYMRRFT
jgi:hypothetical protein